MQRTKTNSKSDKQVAMPESFMVAQLGGEENFKKAKEKNEIESVLDKESGMMYWSYKTLELKRKEEVTQGKTACGSHAVEASDFRAIQASACCYRGEQQRPCRK